MTTDLRALLRTVADEAPGLRKAGVLSIALDGLGAFTLAPAELPAAPPADAAPVESMHALDDPDTFGGELPKRRPMLFDEENDE